MKSFFSLIFYFKSIILTFFKGKKIRTAFQAARLEQLSKLLSELLLFIEQQKHAGQILVDSGRKLVETGNAQNHLGIDELKGFVGKCITVQCI